MPGRLRDVARVLRQHGIEVDEAPGGGSHWRAHANGTVYPLAAHNGHKTELDDIYIKGVCRTFGIDFKTLKAAL